MPISSITRDVIESNKSITIITPILKLINHPRDKLFLKSKKVVIIGSEIKIVKYQNNGRYFLSFSGQWFLTNRIMHNNNAMNLNTILLLLWSINNSYPKAKG